MPDDPDALLAVSGAQGWEQRSCAVSGEVTVPNTFDNDQRQEQQ